MSLRLFFMLLLIVPTGVLFSQPAQLRTFDDLMSALKKGETVTGVFHYAKCKLVIDSVEEKAPDAIGGMTLNAYEYFARNVIRNPRAFVTFSETVLISHPKRGFVWNYVKFKVFEDNKVEINARYLTTAAYETVMNETFYGGMNDGVNEEGIYFFRK